MEKVKNMSLLTSLGIGFAKQRKDANMSKETDLSETGYSDYSLREDGSIQDPGRVNEEIPTEFTPEVLDQMRQAFINEYVMGTM